MSIDAIRKRLMEMAEERRAHPERYRVHELADDSEANELLNDIEGHPHAYVLACLMDRRIKAEKAWAIPHKVRRFLGTFDIRELCRFDEDCYVDLFDRHKLHRDSKGMGRIFCRGARRILDEYEGDAAAIWRGEPSSAAVVYRFLQFHGCGIKIATMAANILARQYGVRFSDYCSIDISPDIHVRRIMTRLGLVPAEIGGNADLNRINQMVIYKAREINPEYPGVIDYSLWEMGKNICRPKNPECSICELESVCPKIM